MAVVDVDMYSEENDYYVVFHGIETNEQKNRIRDWVNALRGVSNQFSEYLFIHDLEDNEDEDFMEKSLVGTISIIPEGRYKGYTIEDVYNANGHYGLAEILLGVHKMESIPMEERKTIYQETVEYTIPLLKDQEISFEDFMSSYHAFVRQYTPGEGKTVEDWLKLPLSEQKYAYEEMVNKIIDRMYNSIKH